MSNQERKLAAIVYTDIVGFSELSASDENYAIELVNTQKNIVEPLGYPVDFMRPSDLAGDLVGTIPVLQWVLEKYLSRNKKYDAGGCHRHHWHPPPQTS